VQGVENHFSRDQERDADRLGVRYAQAAGYDPRAAIAFMELMAEKAPVGSVAQFLDVHPPYPERTELLRAEVAAVAQHQPAD
jgi:predicted Zn-dependent protease